MILMILVIVAFISVIITCVIHDIYIKSFEFKGSIKGFGLKIETKVKSAPSRKE